MSAGFSQRRMVDSGAGLQRRLRRPDLAWSGLRHGAARPGEALARHGKAGMVGALT